MAPRQWQRVQWRLDDGYVTLRGWCAAARPAPEGSAVFTLPPEASPAREETITVSIKGVDRIVTVYPDGVARMQSDLHENMWVTLLGHGFNSAAAVGALDARHAELGAGNELGEAPRDELYACGRGRYKLNTSALPCLTLRRGSTP